MENVRRAVPNFLAKAAEEAGADSIAWATPQIELVRREKGGKSLFFLLNHNDAPQTLKLDRPYKSILEDQTISGTITLNPYDAKILTFVDS